MRISVVIPCFNAERFIDEAVLSVLSQTYQPYEVIVVDDGSTDTSPLKAQYHAGVTVLSKANGGEGSARNAGFAHASGDWVAFLDADDRWESHKLEAQVQMVAVRNSAIVLAHTHYYFFGDCVETPPVSERFAAGDYNAFALYCHSFINSSSILVRRDVPLHFPEWTSDSPDALCYADLCKKGQFAFDGRPLVGYRRHAAQRTAKVEHFIGRHRNLKKWFALPTCTLSREERERLNKYLIDRLFSDLMNSKWRRDWDSYWKVRSYLCNVLGESDHRLREWVYPHIVYTAKDVFDRWIQHGTVRAR